MVWGINALAGGIKAFVQGVITQPGNGTQTESRDKSVYLLAQSVHNIQPFAGVNKQSATVSFPNKGAYGDIRNRVIARLKRDKLWSAGKAFKISLPPKLIKQRFFTVFGHPNYLFGKFGKTGNKVRIVAEGMVVNAKGVLKPHFKRLRIKFDIPFISQFNFNRVDYSTTDFNEKKASINVIPVIAAIDVVNFDGKRKMLGYPRLSIHGGRHKFSRGRGWRIWSKILWKWRSWNSIDKHYHIPFVNYLKNSPELLALHKRWAEYGDVYGMYAVAEKLLGEKIPNKYFRKWGDTPQKGMKEMIKSIKKRLDSLGKEGVSS